MPRHAGSTRAPKYGDEKRQRLDTYVSLEVRLAVYRAAEERNHRENLTGNNRVTISQVVTEALAAHPDVARALKEVEKENEERG